MTPGRLLIAFVLVLTLGGCRQERFYGPYLLEVPSGIMERSASRTFEFPLDQGDLDQQETLNTCNAAQPEDPPREFPCICDYPVLIVGEIQARMDYRLTHESDQAGNVLVWVGQEVGDSDPDPDVLPDLPRIEVLAEHHHHVPIGGDVFGSILEEEMEAADLAWATRMNGDCPQSATQLPSALQTLFGLALESEEPTRISVEFTFRIREAD